MMYVAKSQSQTTVAAANFIRQIDSSIMELRCQNLFSLESQIQKSIRTHDKTPSSKPNVQRRRNALERFERQPRMENLPPVHAALRLKEPCILQHKTTLRYVTLSEYMYLL
jgi:hypothetical protein